jgi:hypothetical protein
MALVVVPLELELLLAPLEVPPEPLLELPPEPLLELPPEPLFEPEQPYSATAPKAIAAIAAVRKLFIVLIPRSPRRCWRPLKIKKYRRPA